MQQTETYKLNKPETTDVFTPAPLNENADKLEAALAGIDSRVTVLEARKLVVGTYKGGQESTLTVELGFRPIMVLARNAHIGYQYTALAVTGQNATGANGASGLVILDNGFRVHKSNTAVYDGTGTYNYIAIG